MTGGRRIHAAGLSADADKLHPSRNKGDSDAYQCPSHDDDRLRPRRIRDRPSVVRAVELVCEQQSLPDEVRRRARALARRERASPTASGTIKIQAGRYTQIWVLDLATKRSTRLNPEGTVAGDPKWSPDGQWIAYWDGGARLKSQRGSRMSRSSVTSSSPEETRRSAIRKARRDGSHFSGNGEGNQPRLAPARIPAASPGGREGGVNCLSCRRPPGPETEQASGDPKVITRYGYTPTAGEGRTRFKR